MTTPSLSTRLGSLGRTSQALAAVSAALDCQAADTRFLRVFHDLEASRAALHAELAKSLPSVVDPSAEDYTFARLLAECPRHPLDERDQRSHRDGYFRHGYPYGTPLVLACVTSEVLDLESRVTFFVPSDAQSKFDQHVLGQKPVDITRPEA